MICLSERKISIHQNKGLLPEISKSTELLKLNNRALQSGKTKNQTKQKPQNEDIYYLKLPQINNKALEKQLSISQVQINANQFTIQKCKIIYGETSLENINKYDKQISDIQNKHNHYINKIEELYMITKQYQ